MGGLPSHIFVLMIAAASAFAGALLTWLVTHLTRGTRRDAARRSPQDKEGSTDDLLRVAQTKNGVAVFVQGKRFHHLREIEDRKKGQETVSAIKAVLAFAEGWLPALQEKQGTSDATNRPPTAGDRSASSPVRQATLVAARRTRGAASSEPLELIEEIDALLQRRLAERPDLARRGVQLTQDVQGSPIIYVGREHYRSADEIPDEEVRVFIQETIQMWESQ